MSRKLAEEEFGAHRPQPMEKAGQLQRRDSVNAEHLYRLRIVAEQHRAAIAGPPPQALLPKGHLPVVEIQPDIGIKQLELIYGRYRCSRWFRDQVDRSYGRPRRVRERGC